MRRLFLLALVVLAPTATRAEIKTIEECDPAVAADPAKAREDAATWFRLGGGTAARLCEAAALEAMGAHASAAELLTGVADNTNRDLGPITRAVVFQDAARLWLIADRPDLSVKALDSADKLSAADPDRMLLRARADAALEDWKGAGDALDQLLATDPDNALALALRAATLRHTGDPKAALADAERAHSLDPNLPEALFETAAALAETGQKANAGPLFLDLIQAHPDSKLAELARQNLQALSGEPAPAAAQPSEPPPEPLRPRPRPAAPPKG